MTKTNKKVVKMTRASYWQVFRIIFVIFSLNLVLDAFHRWNGFRYYASFSEFLPSVALVTTLLSILVAFIAIFTWLPLRVFDWFCMRAGWKIRAYHLMFFSGILIFTGLGVWWGKRYVWTYVETTLLMKLAVFLCVSVVAIFLTWLLRKRVERWIGIIQERITPLVWLFGIWLMISIPLVIYHTWVKQTDKVVSQKIFQPTLEDRKRKNIILVTFDALTARNMSVYGYHRPTTPFISKWAKTASLFTRAEAESNFTTPATASIMTGKRLWTHQTFHLRGSKPVRSNIESLPFLLKNNGYYNMAFVVNTLTSVKTLGISNSFEIAPISTEFNVPASLFGWDNVKYGIIDILLYRLFSDKIRFHDWILKRNPILNKLLISQDFSNTTVPPEKVLNEFLKVIYENPPEPFFAWIHLFPPHDPYLPPEPYMGMFNVSSELRKYKSQKKALSIIFDSFDSLDDYQPFPREVQPTISTFRARYDEFIRYCDKQFEDFITKLRTRNKLKNTVIILSSDHGESFEHGHIMHGGPHLYEQVTSIPLIIKEPDQIEGRIINDLVEQIDIPATILELAGISVPSWMEGRSLVPLMHGKSLPPRPIFSMNFERNPSRGHQITTGTIAVWEGDYKLIHYLEENKSLVFNLKQDPGELNNIFDMKPEVSQRLLNLIHENHKMANERIKKENY